MTEPSEDAGATASISHTETGPAEAPLVALVHGALDRSSGMARIARRLGDRYRVLRYDRRGYGRSTPHPGPFTVAANAGDLVALLDERPAVLVGHSLGSHVVLRVAADRPDLVLGVVVYEAPLSWEPWWPATSGGALALASGDPGDAAEAFVRRMAGNRAWERLPDATKAARRAEGIAFVEELRDVRRGQPWDAGAITAPVVVGHGSEASAHHRRAAPELARRLRDACVVELPGCHHGAHTADPDVFTALLVEPLLERVSPAPGRPPATRQAPGTSTSTS